MNNYLSGSSRCLFKNSTGLKTIENGKVISSEPEIVFLLRKTFLLGLVKINVITEDRKPGPGSNYQYKTLLSLYVCGIKYSFIFRTMWEPLVFKNGKEINKENIN